MLDSVMRPAGGTVPMWNPALTVQRGGHVVSPADAEIYRRVAATGTSGTDPADDLTNYVAVSYSRTAALPAGYQIPYVLPYNPIGIAKTAQTDIGQGVRTQVLSVSGRGQLMHVGHYRYSSGSSAGGCRVEIFIDGRQIYAWEPVAWNTHYAVHYGNALRTTDVNGNGFIAVQHAGGLAFRRSVAVWITPTYGNWLNGNQEFVGYWIRSEA